jgi:hypothetical protein
MKAKEIASSAPIKGYVLAEGFEHNHALVGAEAKSSRKRSNAAKNPAAI